MSPARIGPAHPPRRPEARDHGMDDGEIGSWDARTIAARVLSGDVSPRDVVEAHLSRIDALNPTLNAIVNHEPERARAEAVPIEERLKRGERPPLAGVPVVVKDVIWVDGRRIAQGSQLFRDFIAPRDAVSVERLRAAGAVIIGIGNTSEFACKGVTTNRLYGPTRHPMNEELTPGGSSGGCAVAVAAQLAPLALGTDGGGSSRRPPAHVGVVGFKPSLGAIPDPFALPHAFNGIQVIAPIARNVGDAEIMFAVMAGADPRDPESCELPRADERVDLRIAYSPRLGLDAPVDADVATAVERAVTRLKSDGIRIEEADPQWPDGAGEDALMPLQHVGLANLYGGRPAEDLECLDPDIAAQIERGRSWTGADVARAREASRQIALTLSAFFTRYDLLFCPTAPCVAWPLTQLGPATIGGVPVAPRGHAVFTPFFNHALCPAISIPCGTGRDGLSVGLQIAGPRFADRRVLSFAARAESLFAAGRQQGR
jgi:aspartyl-tRNA(Asn)/glutamyl-tRNA(Gln) amidotransferase subunit A